MCRLLGIITERPVGFHFALEDAPHSIAALSGENPHGWGIAVHDPSNGWTIDKCPMRADECDHFRAAASHAQGDLLLAHVRLGSVGATRLANTHPFRRGPWVFAHNGTITDLPFLAAHTTSERSAGIAGDTDSERLFAFVLSALDQGRARGEIAERAIRSSASALARRTGVGACNFVLSDGSVLYAFCFGRPMFVMVREHAEAVAAAHRSRETGAHIELNDLRGRAVFVASEPLSGEGRWLPLADGDLLRIDRLALHRENVLFDAP